MLSAAEPEFIHIDMKDTDTPAVVRKTTGSGEVCWIPWNLTGMYHRHSLPAHAGLFRDLVDSLLRKRQLRTNAHPLVEVSLQKQGSRTLLHLINLSGHSQTGYFAPIPMSAIRMEVEGRFRWAKSIRSAATLAMRNGAGYCEFVIPRLEDYELVVLES